MGTFLVYILKSSVCLALFYLFYRLLLSKETFHRFNRLALLGVLVLSCVVPFVEVTVQEPSEMAQPFLSLEEMVVMEPVAVLDDAPMYFPWKELMLLAYVGGILFFLVRHMWSLGRMVRLLRTSRREKLEGGIVLFVHKEKVAPFSWMKMIAVSEEDLKENGQAILTHERAHIHNRHSWDLLLAEVCIFVQWFNPAAWLLKQELQTIHEYEADEWVIENGIDAKTYQLLIIKKAVGARLYSIANSFNHSSLKKRITMMIKKKSNPWARMKYLYVLPLAAVAVAAFARPEVSNKLDEISSVKVNDLTSIVKAEEVKSVENSSDEKFKVSGTVLSADTKVPVMGASVIIRGTTNGTLTDLDGKFTLTGLKKDDVIQVSFVGFQTRSVIVKDESPLTILLNDAVQNLDEMVVVAMAPNEDGTTTIKAQMKDKNGEKSYLEGKMASTKKDGMTVNQVDWQKKASNSEPQEKVIFQVVEEMPQFPGGMGEAMKFLAKNMKYPVAAQQAKIEGRVIVQFVVEKDGSVSDVKVMRGVNSELDAEAIRVVSMMPKWIPGKQRGKAVAVKYTMPIMFRLQTPASEKEKNSSPIVMEVEEGASKESVDGMMNLVRPNSQEEDAPVIRINGTEDKLPLVVVDGEVKGNGTEHLSKVSVDQIESISVLKGATAEAEYGDKAKDGAVIITTKKNKK